MPIPLSLLALGAVVVAGAGTSRRRLGVRTIKAERALLLRGVPSKSGNPPTISQAHGWVPLNLTGAKQTHMEWGFCLWDLKKAQTRFGSDDKLAQGVAAVIGKAVEYVIGIVKAATADISFCYVVEIPATKLAIEGVGTVYVPSTQKHGASDGSIAGWNPGTSRPGFPVDGVAPLPSGYNAWGRNLGDLYGWGENVWQLVVLHDGELRSFPAMDRAGWRRGLQLAGERETDGTPSGFGATEDGEIKPGIVPYFKANRRSGQSYKWRPRTRVKAMNRFS